MKLLLDSNVVIQALETESEQHGLAQQVVNQAPLVGHETHVSELLYLEVLSKPGLTDSGVMTLYNTASSNLSFNWPVSRNIILKAAELRRHHSGLKTPDAIHLATAVVHACDYFVSDDKKLLQLKIDGLSLINLRKAASL